MVRTKEGDEWIEVVQRFMVRVDFRTEWTRPRIGGMARRYRLDEGGGLMLGGYDRVWRAVPNQQRIT